MLARESLHFPVGHIFFIVSSAMSGCFVNALIIHNKNFLFLQKKIYFGKCLLGEEIAEYFNVE